MSVRAFWSKYGAMARIMNKHKFNFLQSSAMCFENVILASKVIPRNFVSGFIWREKSLKSSLLFGARKVQYSISVTAYINKCIKHNTHCLIDH